MQRFIAILISVTVIAGGALFTSLATATAQDAPPNIGEVVLADDLTSPSLANAYECPSGRMTRQFGNDGLTVTTSGGCQTPDGYPGSGIDSVGELVFSDGEVSVDVRQLGGSERTQAHVLLRTNLENDFSWYGTTFNVVRNSVNIYVRENGQEKQLAFRSDADLASKVKPNDWNTLAFRAKGPNLWVFVNDVMVLSATDATFDSGSANVVVKRGGPPAASDMHQVSAVIRNVRISSLSGGDNSRVPSYTPPQALRKAKLGNLALLPASLLPFKAEQAIANQQAPGTTLVVLPAGDSLPRRTP